MAETLVMGRGQETAGLMREQLLHVYSKMVLARAVSEALWLLQRQGKVWFVVSCEGHEAAQVGSAYALERGVDFFVPYYRDMGVALVAGMSAYDIILSAFALPADPSSGGRQMTCHFSSPALKIVSGSSPVASQISHAVGIALAAKIKREKSIAIVYFGDGATSKGEFHEGLNFASVHKLPVVFLCENNGLAISVPTSKQSAVPRVAERAAAYGIPGRTVDGMDVLAVYRATRQAVEQARAGLGPSLIEALVYRYAPHTSNDDDTKYRAREVVEEARKRDPIKRFQETLERLGVVTPQDAASIQGKIKQEVQEAVRAAEKSPPPKPEDALSYVYGSQEAP